MEDHISADSGNNREPFCSAADDDKAHELPTTSEKWKLRVITPAFGAGRMSATVEVVWFSGSRKETLPASEKSKIVSGKGDWETFRSSKIEGVSNSLRKEL
ncbi:hypothetical protein EYF80_000664 [Liparis tanakae]|uniref:Uncharacterized protein n=1 Tax=Liparis tanakae TaxID=230148 RepID=A0A4Z2JGH7_9TELE|nr:hypothetical protein EYF80_000664 [Liparis tanakae]